MAALPQKRMSVDEFLVWVEEQPGRHELFRGSVYAMTPERAGHAELKFAVQTALANGIRGRRLPCHMLPDGMYVSTIQRRMSPMRWSIADHALRLRHLKCPTPVIVAEVLPPSTRHVDAQIKLAGYFRLSSVAHYLVIDPDKPLVIHHARKDDDSILTRIVSEGTIILDPPGIELSIADIYPALGA